jgi:hypothetical protein
MTSIEMLSKERFTELWPVLEPMLQAACEGNEIAKEEFDAKDIYVLVQTELCVVFAGFEDERPACVVALQFSDVHGKKCADVIAMAGRRLLKFKAAYWDLILEWLRANDVQFLDAYVPNDRVNIYRGRFGFTKSCSYMRMVL